MAADGNDLEFAYDLTLDEARRRTAILEAIGDDWDPIAVLAEEESAYEMLYSDLDAEQQRVYPACQAELSPLVHSKSA